MKYKEELKLYRKFREALRKLTEMRRYYGHWNFLYNFAYNHKEENEICKYVDTLLDELADIGNIEEFFDELSRKEIEKFCYWVNEIYRRWKELKKSSLSS